MSLREKLVNIDKTYPDSQCEDEYWWSERLGINPEAIREACLKSKVETHLEKVNKGKRLYNVAKFPVSEFPKLLTGIARLTFPGFDHLVFPDLEGKLLSQARFFTIHYHSPNGKDFYYTKDSD